MIQHGRKVRQEKGDILDHGQSWNERKLLKDHPDAKTARIVRGTDLNDAAAELNRPRIGLVKPVEDLDQRGLAGPVLTQECVHLARVDVEVDAIVGEDPRKGLRDPPQGDQRLHVMRPPRPPADHPLP